MYGVEVRRTAIQLRQTGMSWRAISKQTNVSVYTLRQWLADPEAALRPRQGSSCFACARLRCPDPDNYAYLLGQYLGDGHLVTAGIRVPRLRIACADDYPGIAAEVDTAIQALCGHTAGSVQAIGCAHHYAYWMHWPCLFPQHGPGRKHERRIVLEPWQQKLIDSHPWPLIRGLIHSDGCRATNHVRAHGKAYDYPRYFFNNKSRDILTIFTDALDRVGVQWRFNRYDSVSVARRTSVALLDEHVGAKY